MENEGAISLSASTASFSLDDGPSAEQRHPRPALPRHPSGPPSSPTHLSTQRLRKAFFRAASFLQEAYYVYREYTYDQPLIPFTHSPTQIHLIHDAAMEAHETPFDLCELLLFPFPEASVHSEIERKALLTTCMCEDAAVVMADMIARVLGPLTTQICEVSVRTLDPPLTVHLIPSPSSSSPSPSPDDSANGNEDENGDGGGSSSSRNRNGNGAKNGAKPDPAVLNHYAHWVRLRSGEQFALDLTAAQYGWHDDAPPPWQRHMAERVRTFYFHVRAGGLRVVDDAYVCAIRSGRGWSGVGTAGRDTRVGCGSEWEGVSEDERSVAWWCMGRRWDELLVEWERKNGSVAEWVGCADEGVWRAKRSAVLERLRSGVEGFVEGLPEIVKRFGGRVGEEERQQVRERVREFADVYPELQGMVESGFAGEDGARNGFNKVRDILWKTCQYKEWEEEDH